MTKYSFHSLVYLFFLAALCTSSCSSQVSSSSPKEMPTSFKQGPKIIGTPPSASHHNPYNDSNLVSQYIRSIFEDSKGNYWFGPAGQSVARYDGETLEYYSRAEFFQGNHLVEQDNGNSVHAIAEDHNENIWFGTDLGVIKYDGKSFTSYTKKNGLNNTRIGRGCILVDQAGRVWVGTRDGVYRYRPSADSTGGQCFSLFDLLPPIHVKDILEDNQGHLWFASEDQGVYRYETHRSDGQDGVISNFTEKAGLGDNYAGGIAQDHAGNFWFTMEDGICKYDGESFTSITTKDGIGGSEIWGMIIEESGIIWITARGSTTRFDPSLPLSDPKTFMVFTPEDGLNCCVQSMYQDRSGNMWWGTGQGLYRFDGKRFYQVRQHGPWP